MLGWRMQFALITLAFNGILFSDGGYSQRLMTDRGSLGLKGRVDSLPHKSHRMARETERDSGEASAPGPDSKTTTRSQKPICMRAVVSSLKSTQ
jgi:hypothetical protein